MSMARVFALLTQAEVAARMGRDVAFAQMEAASCPEKPRCKRWQDALGLSWRSLRFDARLHC